MNYQDIYQSKLVTVDEAVSHIRSNNDVIVAMCASEPQGCMSRFHIVATAWRTCASSPSSPSNLRFLHEREMKGHFELASWFHAPGSREALKNGVGTVTYVPNMLHRAARDRIYARRPDIFFGTCTPPDKHGFVSLASDHLRTGNHRSGPDRRARGQPGTSTDPGRDSSACLQGGLLRRERPGGADPSLTTPSKTDLAIGANIADLVEDGSTIQLGIGGIPMPPPSPSRTRRTWASTPRCSSTP